MNSHCPEFIISLRGERYKIFMVNWTDSHLLRLRQMNVHQWSDPHWGRPEWGERVELHQFDTSITCDWTWRNWKQFLLWLGPQQWAMAAFKTLKRGKNDRKEKCCFTVLPVRIAQWAHLAIAKRHGDEPCVDNRRVANIRVSSQVRRYKKRQADGCCGSNDWKEVGPDGNTYLLGYNFGH